MLEISSWLIIRLEKTSNSYGNEGNNFLIEQAHIIDKKLYSFISKLL